MTHDRTLWMSLSVVAVAIALSAPDMRGSTATSAEHAATAPSMVSTPAPSVPAAAPSVVAIARSPVPAPTLPVLAPDAGASHTGAGAEQSARAPASDEAAAVERAGDAAPPRLFASTATPALSAPETPVNPVALRAAALLAAAKAPASSSPGAGRWARLVGKDFDAELRCLALNIYWEARSEPALGRFAVAAVTLNRVGHKRFPNTVCGVVRQGETLGLHRCQFSWMCDAKSDTPENEAAWREAEHVARSMLQLNLPDPTNGALWYHADYVSPGWAKTMARITRIGRHLFYRAPVRQARNEDRFAG